MLFLLFFVLPSCYAQFSGRKWPLIATGRVTCNGEPLIDLPVKLMDEDFILVADDVMGSGKTDENGHFEISGSGEDAFGSKPEPYILIEYNYNGKYGNFTLENSWGMTRKEKSQIMVYPKTGGKIDFQEIQLGVNSSHCSYYKKFYKTFEDAYKNTKAVKDPIHIRTEVKKPQDYSLAQCSSPGLVILPKDCTPVILTAEKAKDEVKKASVKKDCKEVLVKKEKFSNCTSRYSPKYGGVCKAVQICQGGTLSGLCPGKNNIKCCISEDSPLPEPTNPLIKKETFLKLLPDTVRNRALFPYFDKALKDANINTCHAQAAFVAQIAYESNDLWSFEEYKGDKYEGDADLGNTQQGDGPKYKGRGIIRLIGRAAYQKVQDAIGQPIIDNPEMVSLPQVAFSSTAWLWNNGLKIIKGNSLVNGDLNELCDGTNYGFHMLTYAINEKMSGIDERIKRWKKAIDILRCSNPSPGHGPNCTSGEAVGQCMLAVDCEGNKPVDDNHCPKLKSTNSPVRCCIKGNNTDGTSRYLPYYQGSCIDVSRCNGGTLSGLCKGGSNIRYCIPKQSSLPEPTNPVIPKDTYLKLFADTVRNRALFPYFDKALKDGNITTCHAQAAFVAQMGHETSDFTKLEEMASGTQYEGNVKWLGNTEPGDGPKYKGRGIIHLTGRSNYKRVQVGTGYQIIDHPEMVTLPRVAFDTTIWMWKKGFRIVQGKKIKSRSLSTLCDGTTYSYYLITYAINGGHNGQADRLRRWDKAIKTLGCSAKTRGHGPSCTDEKTGESGVCDIDKLCAGRSFVNDKDCPKTVKRFVKCCIITG